MRVAVVGATGAVGQEMLVVLEQRGFPVTELRLLASARSSGRTVTAFGTVHEVRPASPDAFKGVDLALFSAGADLARALAPAARDAGALVVDNSSAYRMDPDVPLVIPEINGDTIDGHRGIISNPNCSATLLCMAMAPLHRAAGLRRLVVCSYQAVSGAGARAMEEMRRQEQDDANGREPTHDVFPAVIAHNVLPWVGGLNPDGDSGEETKVRDETRRVLGLPDLAIGATCVRVPVWRAHAEAIHVELQGPLRVDAAIAALAAMPGVRVSQDELPTPRAVAETDDVVVGRVREDRAFKPGLALWGVMDQLRKGAALNAVQIAECALKASA